MPFQRILTIVLLIASAASAQPDARSELSWLLEQLVAEPARAAEALHGRFSEDFAAAVPKQILQAQLAQMKLTLVGEGPLDVERIDPASTDLSITAVVRSADTQSPLTMHLVLTPESKIAGFTALPVAIGGKLDVDTWTDLDDVLRTLPGRTSLAAMRLADGELSPVHTFQPEPQLAVGSAFKLYVLGALARFIDETDATWDQELPIDPEFKTLPSGTMQNEPDGSMHPLSSFAAHMIAVSDNTATDHLIRHIGRGRVEAYLGELQDDPARTLPFMTTDEMFSLKLGGDPDLATRYAEADTERRRELLATDVAHTSPKMLLASAWTQPVHIDTIEWFAATTELCEAMAELREVGARPEHGPLARALRLSTGLSFWQADWTDIAYKGGSEPGVLNFTWLLTRADGEVFALSLTWNNTEAPVDHAAFIDVAAEAVTLLAGHAP